MYCYALFTASFSAAMGHEEGATLELLDALVDKRHRSYMSAVRGTSLGTFRTTVPMSTMPIDPRWVSMYGLNMSHILIISLNVSCNLIIFFRVADYAYRVFSRLRDLLRETWQTLDVDRGTRLQAFSSICPSSRHFSTIGVRRRTLSTSRSVR